MDTSHLSKEKLESSSTNFEANRTSLQSFEFHTANNAAPNNHASASDIEAKGSPLSLAGIERGSLPTGFELKAYPPAGPQ